MSLTDDVLVNSGNETTPVANKEQHNGALIPPMYRKLYDPDVTFEEYFYYAQRTREEERAQETKAEPGLLQQVFSPNRKKITTTKSSEEWSGSDSSNQRRIDAYRTQTSNPAPGFIDNDNNESVKERRSSSNATTEKRRHSKLFHPSHSSDGKASITEDEWRNAARALRTASWGAGFYLITTDILGPYGVGFAMGTLGWAPGIVLYTVFAFMAGYCGYLLWKVYLGLDSYEYPLRNYGDLAYRTMGTVPRYVVNILQSIQMLLITGQVIIQNGQGISQTAKFRLCYVVCTVIFVAVGFVIGQVRTLRNFGAISIVAVGLNLLVIFISMGVMAHSPPNYAISVLGSAGSAVNPETITPDADGNYPAIVHYNGLPSSSGFIGAVNGLMSGVFAYGGAQLFVEIMAEMRRPRDFLKSMWSAQLFIWAVYLIYGCYVYYWQGQYSYQISYMGLSVYGFQAACDMMAVVSGLIAAALYGNIGIKVLYNQILMELLHFPPLTTPTGKKLFATIVPIYWSVAFVVAAAIPDYFGFVSVIASFCIVQFSYSFPPMLHLAYNIQKNLIRPEKGEGFDVTTGKTVRGDGVGVVGKNQGSLGKRVWRIVKGFFVGGWNQILFNVWHVVVAGGALATAGLGAYAAIEGMIIAFENPQINAFTCTSPLDLSQVSGG